MLSDARSLFVTGISFAMLGQFAIARPALADGSCQGALNTLINEWNAIAFEAPSKPGQAIVTGKDGHVTSAGQYNYMTAMIRQARAECNRGDAASAMQHIAGLDDRLNRSVHPSELAERQ